MILSYVVAAAENNAIGKNNKLLWTLPNDMKFFKNMTWAMPVLMGRKTFEALDLKPLNGRLNIVLTRNKDFKAPGISVVSNVEDAITIAEKNDYRELMIIGGGEIYKQLLPHADKIYLTRVHHSFNDADAFFPELIESEWQLVSNRDHNADEKHAYPYSFQLWERKH